MSYSSSSLYLGSHLRRESHEPSPRHHSQVNYQREQPTQPGTQRLEKELEHENQKLECENQKLKEELEHLKTFLNTTCRKFEDENQKLECENQRLKEELEHLKTFLNRNITAADISKHTTLIIPGQHNIGDTADKYEKQTKKTLNEFPKQLSDHSTESVRVACNEVFQMTYDTCKGLILEMFKEELKKLVTMPAGRGLGLELCLSADEEECYSDLQKSYGLLLSTCKMRGTSAPVEKVTELVNQQYQEKHLQHSFLPVIRDSVNVAWDMLTLFPPAVLCTPEKYNEEWHHIAGSLEDHKRYYKLIYYRPLMLSHAHGSVAVRATVRRLASSERTPNEDSDYEEDDD